MPVFYDTHAHLDRSEFTEDLPQVVARAEAAGIAKIITIGTDLESSQRAIQLAKQFPNLFAVVGWHPSDAMQALDDLRPALRELARHPKVVALGETGLDYYHLPGGKAKLTAAENEPIKQKQAALFRQHLEVAAELGLGCVIHQREALEDALAQLEPFADRVRGVFHCFANEAAAMRRIVALGFPTRLGGTAYLERCPSPKFFIQSTRDQYGPRAEMETLFATFAEPKRLIWVEAQDHFFKGALDSLEDEILRLGTGV